MRKLIAILLIAFIACVEVDTTPKEEVSDFKELLDLLDLDADSVELIFEWFKNIFNKVKDFFKDAVEKVRESVDYLDKIGVMDKLISLAKTGAKYGVNTLCSTYVSQEICTSIIDAVMKNI